MKIVIKTNHGGIITTEPFGSESRDKFCERVKEIIGLAFKIEDDRLYKDKDANVGEGVA